MQLQITKGVFTRLKINGDEIDFIDQVTNEGIVDIASLLAAPFSRSHEWTPFISIGTGLDEPTSEDIQMRHEKWRKQGTSSVSRSVYTITATFGTGEPDEDITIREIGLHKDIVGGRMIARWKLSAEQSKDSDEEVTVSCEITIA